VLDHPTLLEEYKEEIYRLRVQLAAAQAQAAQAQAEGGIAHGSHCTPKCSAAHPTAPKQASPLPRPVVQSGARAGANAGAPLDLSGVSVGESFNLTESFDDDDWLAAKSLEKALTQVP
jgi:hypothetical protein